MRAATIVVATLISLCIPCGPAAGSASTYTVRSGDSLWRIAELHGVALDDLLAVNGLALVSVIHPGQTVVIPGGSSRDGEPAAEPADERAPDSATAGGRRVTIRPGDSLWSVARASQVTLGALIAVNGLTLDSIIHPGQSLLLPGGAAIPAATPAPLPATGGGPAAAGAETYVVRPGDGLTTIARRLGVGVQGLLDANALAITSIIHPGQRLAVPATSVPTQVARSEHLVPVFARAADEAGVPEDLLMAVAYVESRWDQSARSPDGAVGVGQLMPPTAAWVARDLMGEPGLDISNTTDNIRMSAHLIAWLLDEADGNADRALAMYLQGVYGVRANGISPAAVTYADRVSTIRAQFR